MRARRTSTVGNNLFRQRLRSVAVGTSLVAAAAARLQRRSTWATPTSSCAGITTSSTLPASVPRAARTPSQNLRRSCVHHWTAALNGDEWRPQLQARWPKSRNRVEFAVGTGSGVRKSFGARVSAAGWYDAV